MSKFRNGISKSFWHKVFQCLLFRCSLIISKRMVRIIDHKGYRIIIIGSNETFFRFGIKFIPK